MDKLLETAKGLDREDPLGRFRSDILHSQAWRRQ